MHDFLDLHDDFHFLIWFWSIFAKRNESSGFPYKMLHISAPGIFRGAVFDDGKLGPQTAQKRPSLGGLVMARTTRQKLLVQGKSLDFDENYYFKWKCIFCQNIDTP